MANEPRKDSRLHRTKHRHLDRQKYTLCRRLCFPCSTCLGNAYLHDNVLSTSWSGQEAVVTATFTVHANESYPQRSLTFVRAPARELNLPETTPNKQTSISHSVQESNEREREAKERQETRKFTSLSSSPQRMTCSLSAQTHFLPLSQPPRRQSLQIFLEKTHTEASWPCP